jgi:hypothetical protein
MSHIYEVIPAVELEFDFENLREFLACMRNFQKLKIHDCISMKAALDSFPQIMRGFFFKFWSALCVHFIINNEIKKFTELEYLNFTDNFRGFTKSFLIIFECFRDNSCLFYWRLQDTKQIFSLKTNGNSVKLGDFVKDFLFKSIKKQRNGEDFFVYKLRVNFITPTQLYTNLTNLN